MPHQEFRVVTRDMKLLKEHGDLEPGLLERDTALVQTDQRVRANVNECGTQADIHKGQRHNGCGHGGYDTTTLTFTLIGRQETTRAGQLLNSWGSGDDMVPCYALAGRSC